MSARRLDGAAWAARHPRGARSRAIAAFTAAARPAARARARAGRRRPGLGDLRPQQAAHVRARHGCRAELHRLPATASLDDALALVERLNDDDAVDGILVQSPLPPAMGAGAEQRVFDARAVPTRTSTAFTRVNVGLLVQKRRRWSPARRSGCIAAAGARGHSAGRPPRRGHRPQRHRRQADGAAAAAPRRHGDHLPLADARTCRRVTPHRPTSWSSPPSAGPAS